MFGNIVLHIYWIFPPLKCKALLVAAGGGYRSNLFDFHCMQLDEKKPQTHIRRWKFSSFRKPSVVRRTSAHVFLALMMVETCFATSSQEWEFVFSRHRLLVGKSNNDLITKWKKFVQRPGGLTSTYPVSTVNFSCGIGRKKKKRK